MKNRFLALCLSVVLLTQSSTMPAFTAFQEECKLRPPSKAMAEFNAYMELRKKTFQPGKKLLLEYGLPFNPDLLIDENWRKLLEPAFSRMPEMQKIVQAPALLKGVVIAHTLYLPERIGLIGDTVILARHVVFAGDNALIRGPHNISIFPIETYGLLGKVQSKSSFPSDYRMIRASFMPDENEKSLKKPTTITGGKLTIDVSGCGRKEWVLTKGLKSSGDPVVMALIQSCQSNYGAKGQDGTSYDLAVVSPASDGATGNAGNNGNCATNSPAGQQGDSGGNGSDGIAGVQGGVGGDGQPGSAISATIPDGTTTFSCTYISKGGDGGKGGTAGKGQKGGKGGSGGKGGNGSDCICAQGGPGNGGQSGNGGNGGTGGTGGIGGIGGKGGRGGDISVSVPSNFQSGLSSDCSGGVGGAGGAGGDPGAGGGAGNPGSAGRGATNLYCPTMSATDGGTGQPGTIGYYGNAGSTGGYGSAGGNGTFSVTARPPCYPTSNPPCSPCNNWSQATCSCYYTGCSPIIFDVAGNNLNLTNGANGVNFDLNRDGFKEKIAWTSPNSDDAWLCLDRNNNGQIDDGGELFGNYTTQPLSDNPNGFLALAEYDKLEKGGNNDGVIDNKDDIFNSLKIWQDLNHNGLSDSGELHPLQSAKIHSLSLYYSQHGERDAFGNELKYRAKILSQGKKDLGLWAYDVFLVPGT